MYKCYTFILFMIAGQLAVAQKSPKKPLDHSVYDGWQSVASQKISPDGQWVLYSVMPQAGDAELVITNLKSKAVTRVPRVNNAEVSSDSKYSVFTIKPFYQETRTAKIKKKKPADMPKDTLGILVLGSSQVFKAPRVKSFLLPEHAASVVAYLKEKAPADSSRKKAPAADPSASKTDAGDLVVRKLITGTEKVFSNVTEYSLSGNGKFLVFARIVPKDDTVSLPGVFWYDIEKDVVKKISSGRGTYKNLIFDESGSQLAFTAEKEPEKALVKIHSLYYFHTGLDSAKVLAGKETAGIPGRWAVSGDGKVFFSKNGEKLFFGTAPVPAPKDTTLVDFEVANVDVWNYKDDYLQPMQLKNLDRELKRSYTAVVYPKNSTLKVIQLGDEQLPDVALSDEGNGEFALAATDVGNRIETQWLGSTHKDLYLISTKDGSRKLITSAVRGMASMSPEGNYVAWYNRKDKNWYAYHIATGRQQQLTKGLDVAFYDELNDLPDDPSPYGVAGWTEGDQEVLIYDRFDIWSFDPQGGKPRNITNGAGRRNQITFRYVDFKAERSFRLNENPISSRKQLWLQAFNNKTKENGWYRKSLSGNGAPELVIMAERSYSRPLMAKNASTFIYTKANYQLSPDLYASSDFRKETKLSAINPQQNEYNWGTAELVSWTTPKGHKSDGILYKPEDFDPARKYPMVVYFYEKLSDGLYDYIAPAPTPSRLNISYFVSNGYLVFAPDISYEIGYPGRSAEEFINSGVEALKKNSWVDGTKIGIQGQSWGGYQVAHLITRTNMYAAAWAGAPVVNMTSAYGGIRWETGMNRQFQYERTQSRIGATLWEKPELYIENSPLFHFPKVNTPVVLMANDADGAVPWYQGIEMFTALRRLNKPVWMLNYNGEAHNLMQRQNRKDIQVREQQFFDHYLKGKPAPAWMIKGVPATQKGRNWGFELPEPATAAN